MLQHWFPNDHRFVPESDDDRAQVTEVDDKEEDSVHGAPHHNDNIE
jgi:hypothetical protein